VALVSGLHVGIETAFKNVVAAAELEPGLDPFPLGIQSYQSDWIERLLPFLPISSRGNLRYLVGTRPLYTWRGLDAVWSHLDLPLLPWMLTRNLRGGAAVMLATDSTPRQLREFAGHYNHWGGRSDVKFRLRERLYAKCVGRAVAIQAWSEWAARSLRDDYGVAPARVHVLPPGVDTDFWRPELREVPKTLPRILFVGGDFQRKGGELLLDVFRRRLRDHAELHVVTREGLVEPEFGVQVHSGIGPNAPSLAVLYRTCDLLAIPTRADCFSMAGLEAMASGIPIVTCPVGGVAELFAEGVEGFFVPPGDAGALAATLETLVGDAARRQSMGSAARRLALRRYDARVNTRRLIELIESVAG
jgi:glycosyltransferase involved in cell wall biosynthesis